MYLHPRFTLSKTTGFIKNSLQTNFELNYTFEGQFLSVMMCFSKALLNFQSFNLKREVEHARYSSRKENMQNRGLERKESEREAGPFH